MPKAKDLRDDTLLDIFEAETVGIQISPLGDRVWVCVDGICRLRVKGALSLTISDERPRFDGVRKMAVAVKRGRPHASKPVTAHRKEYLKLKARERRARQKEAKK